MKNSKSIDEFEFSDFRPIWRKLKYHMRDIHLDLFYEVVGVDKYIGRRFYPGCGREDNPRFYKHWFGSGRCHWNVILPCFMMNDGEFFGRIKILTNDRHSVLVDTETNTIMCPTLNKEHYIKDFFDEGYQIMDLIDFIPSVVKEQDFIDFLEKYYENK